MSKHTSEPNVTSIDQAAAWSADTRTEALRTDRAHRLLAQAVEAEVQAHLAPHKDLRDEHGRRRMVRHGYWPSPDWPRAGQGQHAVHTRSLP